VASQREKFEKGRTVTEKDCKRKKRRLRKEKILRKKENEKGKKGNCDNEIEK
jgi:hypothetical protein